MKLMGLPMWLRRPSRVSREVVRLVELGTPVATLAEQGYTMCIALETIALCAVAGLLLVAWPASTAQAQLPFTIPKPAPLSAASLFANHCGICHTVERDGAPRQGPNLAGVFLRKAGALPGFRYSPGFAQADFVWDDGHLDAWLADPQKLIPGAAMKYRQGDPAIRGRIIAWLKEQH